MIKIAPSQNERKQYATPALAMRLRFSKPTKLAKVLKTSLTYKGPGHRCSHALGQVINVEFDDRAGVLCVLHLVQLDAEKIPG